MFNMISIVVVLIILALTRDALAASYSYSNLVGTWNGTCTQFAAIPSGSQTYGCIPYKINGAKIAPISYAYSITYHSDMSLSYVQGAASVTVGKTTYTSPMGSGSAKITNAALQKNSAWPNSGCLTEGTGSYVVSVVGKTYYEAAKYSIKGDNLLSSCKDTAISKSLSCIPSNFYLYTCQAKKV